MSKRLLLTLPLYWLLACSGPIRHPERLSVIAESLPEERLAEAIALAAHARVNLDLAVIEDLHGKSYLQRACSLAADQDVALRLWPILGDPSGRWSNQGNMVESVNHTTSVMNAAIDLCPALDGLLLALDLSLAEKQQLESARQASGLAIAEAALLMNRDDVGFEIARRSLQGVSSLARSHGLRMLALAPGLLADDSSDGDETLARALGTPVEGIAWDEIAFRVERSWYDQHQPPPGRPGGHYSSGLVSAYASAIAEHWSVRAGIVLGTTGLTAEAPAALASSDAMQSDVAAAEAAGIPLGRVVVESLEGLLDRDDRDNWLFTPPAASVAVEPEVDQLRVIQKGIDALAN